MLTIRNEQMKVLCAAARQGLRDRLCKALLDAFPEYASEFTPGDLVSFVEESISRAERWGFILDSTIGDYAGLRLQVGDRFDEHPLVRRVLEDKFIPTEQRVRALTRRLGPKDWARVVEEA
jgi:hypothetical protein